MSRLSPCLLTLAYLTVTSTSPKPSTSTTTLARESEQNREVCSELLPEEVCTTLTVWQPDESLLEKVKFLSWVDFFTSPSMAILVFAVAASAFAPKDPQP